MLVRSVEKPALPPFSMPDRFRTDIAYFMTPAGEHGAPELGAKEYWIRIDDARQWLDDGVMVCLDPATGERRWKRGRYGHGQVLLVGDLLLVQSEKGEVVLVEPDPDELRELGRFSVFDDKTWNSPALAGRYLLLRNHREAALFELPLATG